MKPNRGAFGGLAACLAGVLLLSGCTPSSDQAESMSGEPSPPGSPSASTGQPPAPARPASGGTQGTQTPRTDGEEAQNPSSDPDPRDARYWSSRQINDAWRAAEGDGNWDGDWTSCELLEGRVYVSCPDGSVIPRGSVLDAGPKARAWFADCIMVDPSERPKIVACADGYVGPRDFDPKYFPENSPTTWERCIGQYGTNITKARLAACREDFPDGVLPDAYEIYSDVDALWRDLYPEQFTESPSPVEPSASPSAPPPEQSATPDEPPASPTASATPLQAT